jgi:hypothetical protein
MNERLRDVIFPGGVPSPILDRQLCEPYLDQCQDMIGRFVGVAWTKQKERDPRFPNHVVIVGEDWPQFTEFASAPSDLFPPDPSGIGGIKFGDAFRAETWEVMSRDCLSSIEDLILSMQEGVALNNLSDFTEIAIIDCTGPLSDFFRGSINIIEKGDWGEVLEVNIDKKIFKVYRVTTYQAYKEVDLGESDGVDDTLVIFDS